MQKRGGGKRKEKWRLPQGPERQYLFLSRLWEPASPFQRGKEGKVTFGWIGVASRRKWESGLSRGCNMNGEHARGISGKRLEVHPRTKAGRGRNFTSVLLPPLGTRGGTRSGEKPSFPSFSRWQDLLPPRAPKLGFEIYGAAGNFCPYWVARGGSSRAKGSFFL